MPQVTGTSSPQDNEDAPDAPVIQPSAQTDALDSLLDEIDTTLQANAEQFVRSFVQKGGQ